MVDALWPLSLQGPRPHLAFASQESLQSSDLQIFFLAVLPLKVVRSQWALSMVRRRLALPAADHLHPSWYELNSQLRLHMSDLDDFLRQLRTLMDDQLPPAYRKRHQTGDRPEFSREAQFWRDQYMAALLIQYKIHALSQNRACDHKDARAALCDGCQYMVQVSCRFQH